MLRVNTRRMFRISFRSSSLSISNSWLSGMHAPGSMNVTEPVLDDPKTAPLTWRL